MDVEDFLEPEIAIAAALTAAVTSPQVRKALRTGAVYGLAGLIAAGDAVTTFSKSVGRGIQQASASGAAAVQQTAESAKAAATDARAEASATEGGHE